MSWRSLLRALAGPEPGQVSADTHNQVMEKLRAAQMKVVAGAGHQRDVARLTDVNSELQATVAAFRTENRALNDAIRRRDEHIARVVAGTEVPALQRLVDALTEPPQDGECKKLRLRDQAEANGYARHLERALNLAEGAMMAYRCSTCPRQVWRPDNTNPRYWHAANVDPGERTGRSRPVSTAARREARRGTIHHRFPVEQLRAALPDGGAP